MKEGRHNNVIKRFIIIFLWPTFLCAIDVRVGYVDHKPFSFLSSDIPSGFAIDIWDEIAQDNQLSYTLTSLGSNISSALESLENGHIDLVLGPVSATRDRLSRLDFTRPFFIEQIGVAFHEIHLGFLDALHIFMKKLGEVGFFIIAIFFIVAAHVYWFFYRWHAPEISTRYFRGIGDSMWFMFARLIQIKVLYRPEGPQARVFMAFWLIVSLVFVSGFFGMITSALSSTLYSYNNQTISNIEDLQDMVSGVVRGSENAVIAKRSTAKVISYETLDAAIEALHTQEVDVVIDDYVSLAQEVQEHKNFALKVSDIRLAIDEVSFSLPKGSPYKEKINHSLLRLQEKGFAEAICHRYIPSSAVYCVP